MGIGELPKTTNAIFTKIVKMGCGCEEGFSGDPVSSFVAADHQHTIIRFENFSDRESKLAPLGVNRLKYTIYNRLSTQMGLPIGKSGVLDPYDVFRAKVEKCGVIPLAKGAVEFLDGGSFIHSLVLIQAKDGIGKAAASSLLHGTPFKKVSPSLLRTDAGL